MKLDNSEIMPTKAPINSYGCNENFGQVKNSGDVGDLGEYAENFEDHDQKLFGNLQN